MTNITHEIWTEQAQQNANTEGCLWVWKMGETHHCNVQTTSSTVGPNRHSNARGSRCIHFMKRICTTNFLRIPVFCAVMLCYWTSGLWCTEQSSSKVTQSKCRSQAASPLTLQTPQSFKMSRTTCLMIQCHIPEYVDVCMCGFCKVWVCVCVGFVMCGCVYVWVLGPLSLKFSTYGPVIPTQKCSQPFCWLYTHLCLRHWTIRTSDGLYLTWPLCGVWLKSANHAKSH